MRALFDFLPRPCYGGAVAGVVGIEVGVVSGVFNLESSGVDAPDSPARRSAKLTKDPLRRVRGFRARVGLSDAG